MRCLRTLPLFVVAFLVMFDVPSFAVDAQPDFVLTSSLYNTQQITAGAQTSITYTITNIGDASGELSLIIVLLPPEFSFESYTSTSTWFHDGPDHQLVIGCNSGTVDSSEDPDHWVANYIGYALLQCWQANSELTAVPATSPGESITITFSGHATAEFSSTTKFVGLAGAVDADSSVIDDQIESANDPSTWDTNNVDVFMYSFTAAVETSSGSGTTGSTQSNQESAKGLHVQGSTSEQESQKIATTKGLTDLKSKKGKPELSLHKPSFGKHNTIPPEATMSMLARYRNRLIAAALAVIVATLFLTRLRINYARNKRQNREYRKALKISESANSPDSEDEPFIPAKPFLHFEHTEKVTVLPIPEKLDA